MRLKALVVCWGWVGGLWGFVGDWKREAKRLLRTHKNVKGILYSAKCGVLQRTLLTIALFLATWFPAISPILGLWSPRSIQSYGIVTLILNIDGDLALSPELDAYYWNPHMVGSPNAVWNAEFNGEAKLIVVNQYAEAGHVAMGAWPRSFKDKKRVPLNSDILVDVDIMISKAEFQGPNEWFRMAIACSLYDLTNGSFKYLEFDFWDSPNTYNGPIGGYVHKSAKVIEIKVDQLEIDIWRRYRFNIFKEVEKEFGKPDNFELNAVYIVIEYANSIVEAAVHAKNLWVTKPC